MSQKENHSKLVSQDHKVISDPDENNQHSDYGRDIRKIMLKLLLVISLVAGSVLTGLLYYQTKSFAITEAEKKLRTCCCNKRGFTTISPIIRSPRYIGLKKKSISMKRIFLRNFYQAHMSPEIFTIIITNIAKNSEWRSFIISWRQTILGIP